MIFAVSDELRWISSIAEFIRCIASAPLPAARCASEERLSACCALAAFCFVIDDISSRLDDVSSRPAACSAAPSARDCDAEETCPDAALTSDDPSDSASAIRPSRRVSPRDTNSHVTSEPIRPTTVTTTSVAVPDRPTA